MKDLKSIVKKIADRYGVDYDENSSGPKIKRGDGTVEELDSSKRDGIFKFESDDKDDD